MAPMIGEVSYMPAKAEASPPTPKQHEQKPAAVSPSISTLASTGSPPCVLRGMNVS